MHESLLLTYFKHYMDCVIGYTLNVATVVVVVLSTRWFHE